MPDTKLGDIRLVPDIRSSKMGVYIQNDLWYDIIDVRPIINKKLCEHGAIRTHSAAVWYDEEEDITVLDKINEFDRKIQQLELELSKTTKVERQILNFNTEFFDQTSNSHCYVYGDKIVDILLVFRVLKSVSSEAGPVITFASDAFSEKLTRRHDMSAIGIGRSGINFFLYKGGGSQGFAVNGPGPTITSAPIMFIAHSTYIIE